MSQEACREGHHSHHQQEDELEPGVIAVCTAEQAKLRLLYDPEDPKGEEAHEIGHDVRQDVAQHSKKLLVISRGIGSWPRQRSRLKWPRAGPGWSRRTCCSGAVLRDCRTGSHSSSSPYETRPGRLDPTSRSRLASANITNMFATNPFVTCSVNFASAKCGGAGRGTGVAGNSSCTAVRWRGWPGARDFRRSRPTTGCLVVSS